MDEETLQAELDSTGNEDEGNDVNVTSEPKVAGSAVKLLKQRNEARAQLEEMKKNYVPAEELKKMGEKLAKFEEMLVDKTLKDEAKQEMSKFFEKAPKAKEFETDMSKLMNEKDLTVEEAFRLVASEKNPALLLDEQTLNKQDSNSALGGVPKSNEHKVMTELTVEEAKEMSDDEFLRQSEELGQKARIASGLLR